MEYTPDKSTNIENIDNEARKLQILDTEPSAESKFKVPVNEIINLCHYHRGHK